MDNRYKRLENIFIALLAIQTIYTLTALYLSFNDIQFILSFSRTSIKIVIMIQIFITVVFGNYFFNSKMKLAGKEADANKKHQLYHTAYSVRLGLLSICNLVNITAFIFTSNEIYVIVTVPLLFLYFIYKPDRKIFENHSAVTKS
jgi:hypothetical protein